MELLHFIISTQSHEHTQLCLREHTLESSWRGKKGGGIRREKKEEGRGERVRVREETEEKGEGGRVGERERETEKEGEGERIW